MSDIKRDMLVTILGFDLGWASGWDEISVDSLQFYDFDPSADGLSDHLSPGTLFVNFETGVVEVYGEQDVIIQTGKLFEILTKWQSCKG